jgi:hypothetical protein
LAAADQTVRLMGVGMQAGEMTGHVGGSALLPSAKSSERRSAAAPGWPAVLQV